MVVDQNSFLLAGHSSRKKITFANLSRTPCLTFAGVYPLEIIVVLHSSLSTSIKHHFGSADEVEVLQGRLVLQAMSWLLSRCLDPWSLWPPLAYTRSARCLQKASQRLKWIQKDADLSLGIEQSMWMGWIPCNRGVLRWMLDYRSTNQKEYQN